MRDRIAEIVNVVNFLTLSLNKSPTTCYVGTTFFRNLNLEYDNNTTGTRHLMGMELKIEESLGDAFVLR